jgi:hypothetical protein
MRNKTRGTSLSRGSACIGLVAERAEMGAEALGRTVREDTRPFRGWAGRLVVVKIFG